MAVELLDFAALWDLIESRFTKTLHKRHVTAIERLCLQREDGVFLDELPQFTKLLTLCKTHIENGKIGFLSPSIAVLTVTLRPHITSSSFEKIGSHEIIVRHFELIASFLSMKYEWVTTTIAVGLQRFVRDVLDYKALTESGMGVELVDSLRSWCYGAHFKVDGLAANAQRKGRTEDMSLSLAKAIKILSLSPLCAASLVDDASILELKIMYDPQMSDAFLLSSVETLWNIVEALPARQLSGLLSTDYLDLFAALLSSLDTKIAWTHKAQHRRLRNSVLAVVLLVAKQQGAEGVLHFEQSQLVDVLLALISRVLSQRRDDEHADLEVESLQSAEDFEALCLAYCVVLRICHSYRILSMLLHEGFAGQMIGALFAISGVDAETTEIHKVPWTETQLSHLRQHGLFVIGRLIELVPRRLVADGLVLRMCRFLVQHQHAIASRHAIRKQADCVTASLLRVLVKASEHLSTAAGDISETVMAILCVPDLHHVLLRIVKHVSFAQEMRTDAVLILAHLAAIQTNDDGDESKSSDADAGATSEAAEALTNPFHSAHAPEVLQTVCILLGTLPSIPLYDALLHALIFCLRSVLRPRMAHNIAVFLNEKGLAMLLRLLRKAQPAVAESALNLILQMIQNKNFASKLAEYSDSDGDVRSQLVRLWTDLERDSDVDTETKARVQRSISCLFLEVQSLSPKQSADIECEPRQRHQIERAIERIVRHAQLREGEEWTAVYQELLTGKDRLRLLKADDQILREKIESYDTLRAKMRSEEEEMEKRAKREMDENLQELVNKLQLYKAQKKPVGMRSSTVKPKEYVLAATIKLNKDQKDEIVAGSLQLKETMRKVLGDVV